MRHFNSIRRSGRSVTETTSSLVIPVTHFNKNEYVYKPINHITQKQHLITWLCTPLYSYISVWHGPFLEKLWEILK